MLEDDYLYEAERALFTRYFHTYLDDPEEYHAHVMGTQFVAWRYPKLLRREPTIKIVDYSHKYAKAHCQDRIIELPHWAKTDVTYLHELSHIAAPWEKNDHGPRFRRTYLDFVRRFKGADAASCLKHSILAYGLEI